MNKYAITYHDYGQIYVDWYWSNSLENALYQYNTFQRRTRSPQASLVKIERI